MNKSKAGVIVPVLIIGLGVAWLLTTLNVLPGVDWIWTGGLGICGLLILAVSGLNKLSVVLGPFLLVGSVFSILRQTGKLAVNLELPVLFIIFGTLLLIAYFLPLPLPDFLKQDDPNNGGNPPTP
jgi:hypothetical protein